MLKCVDDITYANSNLVQIKKAVANLRCMEKCEGFTFNNEKNKTELMKRNKKRNADYKNIKLEVKCGEIQRTNEYKYLGKWYNENGNHSTSIKKKKKKMITLNKLRYGNKIKNISKSELRELEEIQGTILRKICGQRKTIPLFWASSTIRNMDNRKTN